MAFNVAAAIAQAKAKGPNMTEAQAGGSFELPAVGFTRLRFVGYFEVGKHESEWQGQKRVNDRVELVFELSGPKHQPRDTDSGKVPHRITVKIKKSLGENSSFFKLFSALNYESKATHIAELLGNDFVGDVTHSSKKINGKDFTFANLGNIRKPFVVDAETGDERRIQVDPPLTEVKLFLWDFCDEAMWDSIFIPGEYPETKNDKGEVTKPARSKNVLQDNIRSALNFKALPIYTYAAGKVKSEDSAALDAAVGDVATPAKSEAVPAGEDEMAGIA